jgi:hypothetical protein
MMHGYNLIWSVLGMWMLVTAVTVLFDAYTRPVVNQVRRVRPRHFNIATWAERFQKKHFHLHIPHIAHNTHKHRAH